jgi:hypothetical protein
MIKRSRSDIESDVSNVADDGRVVLGAIYEGENDFGPFYNDLIQRCTITHYRNGWFHGFILGFDQQDSAKWRREKLHELHESPESHESKFQVNDHVHFRIMQPRFGTNEDGSKMELIDAGQIEEGHLWCKGTITHIADHNITVEHTAWNAQNPDEKTKSTVDVGLIRAAYNQN